MQRGAMLHTDAAQSVGKVALNVRELGVDLLSVAGHKLYAPKGVGALFVRRGTPIAPLLVGGGHERGLRPGTENVASIVGLGVACEIAGGDMEISGGAHCAAFGTNSGGASPMQCQAFELNGHPTLRLPNTLNVRFPRASGNAILAGAPEIAASTGSACHAGGESASAVVLAMGRAPRRGARLGPPHARAWHVTRGYCDLGCGACPLMARSDESRVHPNYHAVRGIAARTIDSAHHAAAAWLSATRADGSVINRSASCLADS